MTGDEDRAVNAAQGIEAQMREILELIKERGRLIESIAENLGVVVADLQERPATARVRENEEEA